MRVPLLISALAVAPFASAQPPTDPNESLVYTAYVNQRTGTGYVLKMTGTETYGKTSVAVHAELYYRLVSDSRTGSATSAQAELDVYTPTTTGEALAYRMVGDGNTLYRYDMARREVSATVYGFYGNQVPKDAAFVPRYLLTQLRGVTPGLASYLVRLADELSPTGDLFSPRYANWVPGPPVLQFGEVPAGYHDKKDYRMVYDPITGRPFTQIDPKSQQYVFYGLNSPATSRTTVFSLYDARPDPDNPLWEVASVSVAMRTPGRVVDLTITPNATTAFPVGAFAPYTGAQGAAFRPVVAKG